MYSGQVPRTAPAAVRTMLIERAAAMLRRREPVSLRSVVAGTGVSTMAVYTHFDGMPGLWRAVRQEGFARLSSRIAAVEITDDPVRDLSALGVAYTENALADPDLYRVMFDASADLDDPAVADDAFGALIDAARRARGAGRFRADVDPARLALRWWAAGHGLMMLVTGGVIPADGARAESDALAIALFVDAGDDPGRCRRSMAAGRAG